MLSVEAAHARAQPKNPASKLLVGRKKSMTQPSYTYLKISALF